MLANPGRHLAAAAAVVGLAATFVAPVGRAATSPRNGQPCPLILTDGRVVCYRPYQVVKAEKSTPIRGFDPGYVVWRETGRRVSSIEVIIGVTPPYPPSETNRTLQLFFNSGRRPNTPIEPCSSRPKFVLVGATVRQHWNGGVRITRHRGCWEMTANWTRKHIALTVETNYQRSVLVRTGLAVFNAGRRHGL